LIRKRGFLRKDGGKEAITNNVVIEELLGPNSEEAVDDHSGCICVEDVIDTIFKCWKPQNDNMFSLINKTVWPFLIASKRDTIEKANVNHQATGKLVRKKNTKVKKGGYQGFMDQEINEYIQPLM
jgi:hypothetical protein